MPYGGFDAAKAKIVRVFFEPGARKPNRLRVALFGEVVDDSPAGIPKPHHFSDLIVCLARRIIACPAQMKIVAEAIDSVEQRVTSRSQECEVRKRHLVLELDCEQMRFQMIDTDVRYSRSK